jgi:hypothetical protein
MRSLETLHAGTELQGLQVVSLTRANYHAFKDTRDKSFVGRG